MMVGMVDNTDWWRPRTSAPVMQPDSRSPLRKGLNAVENTFRQSGLGNFLPSPGEVGRGALSFLFPAVMEQQAQGKPITPGSFLGDAALAFTPVGLGNAGRLSAIVRRLNKSDDVGDFISPETMQYSVRPNDANEGLFRPGAQSFDYKNVPEPATPYTFGLVPTEKLAPLREFDRAAAPEGLGNVGPDNIQKLMDHLAQGGRWSDPTAVAYYPNQNWAYLAEGNHRLALAEALGLEKLPTTLWRAGDAPPMRNVLKEGAERTVYGPVGKKVGPLDTNQLRRDPYSDFSNSVGEFYVPPTMHPLLLKYFQQ
jgi:hypothetical protein